MRRLIIHQKSINRKALRMKERRINGNHSRQLLANPMTILQSCTVIRKGERSDQCSLWHGLPAVLNVATQLLQPSLVSLEGSSHAFGRYVASRIHHNRCSKSRILLHNSDETIRRRVMISDVFRGGALVRSPPPLV